MTDLLPPKRDALTDGAMSSSSNHFRARRISSSDNFVQPAAGLAFQDQ